MKCLSITSWLSLVTTEVKRSTAEAVDNGTTIAAGIGTGNISGVPSLK
jgi:hypothetical protein